MNDEQELAIARTIRRHAEEWAGAYDTNPCDLEAATVAILMRAFELATQDLSVERRNKLLKGEWE